MAVNFTLLEPRASAVGTSEGHASIWFPMNLGKETNLKIILMKFDLGDIL